MDFSTFVRRVGANLRRARWAAGKTQEELAVEALTFRLLGALERGHGNPTLKTLFLLANALNVKVKDLVDVDGTGARTKMDEAKRPRPGRKARTAKRRKPH